MKNFSVSALCINGGEYNTKHHDRLLCYHNTDFTISYDFDYVFLSLFFDYSRRLLGSSSFEVWNIMKLYNFLYVNIVYQNEFFFLELTFQSVISPYPRRYIRYYLPKDVIERWANFTIELSHGFSFLDFYNAGNLRVFVDGELLSIADASLENYIGNDTTFSYSIIGSEPESSIGSYTMLPSRFYVSDYAFINSDRKSASEINSYWNSGGSIAKNIFENPPSSENKYFCGLFDKFQFPSVFQREGSALIGNWNFYSSFSNRPSKKVFPKGLEKSGDFFKEFQKTRVSNSFMNIGVGGNYLQNSWIRKMFNKTSDFPDLEVYQISNNYTTPVFVGEKFFHVYGQSSGVCSYGNEVGVCFLDVPISIAGDNNFFIASGIFTLYIDDTNFVSPNVKKKSYTCFADISSNSVGGFYLTNFLPKAIVSGPLTNETVDIDSCQMANLYVNSTYIRVIFYLPNFTEDASAKNVSYSLAASIVYAKHEVEVS